MKKIILCFIVIMGINLFGESEKPFYPKFTRDNKTIIKKVEQYLIKKEGEYDFSKRKRNSIYTSLVDLDRDGKDEIIMGYFDNSWYGKDNCGITIYKNDKNGLKVILDFSGLIGLEKDGKQTDLVILDEGKWKTIVINDYYYEWKSKGYNKGNSLKKAEPYKITPEITEYINKNFVLVDGGGKVELVDFFHFIENSVCEINYDYYVAKYEVTQEEYKELVGTGDENIEKYNIGKRFPMVEVTVEDARDYCNLLNKKYGLPKSYDKNGNSLDENGNIAYDMDKIIGFRLLCEAEWQFAANGGNKSKGYIYSGSNNIEEIGWINKNSGNKLHEVGIKKPNELGIYDMTGNVWEYTDSTDGKWVIIKGGGYAPMSDDQKLQEEEIKIKNNSVADDNGIYERIGFRIGIKKPNK